MQITKEDIGTVVVETPIAGPRQLVTVLELGAMDRVRVQGLTSTTSHWALEPQLTPLADHEVPGFQRLDRVRWTRDGALFDGVVVTAYLGSVQVISGTRWFAFGDDILARGHGIDELTKVDELADFA